MSDSPHRSGSLQFAMRKNRISVTLTRLPVGGMPIIWPLWVPFANIASCIMGIETLMISRNDPSKVKSRRLLVEEELIHSKAHALDQLARDVNTKFSDVAIERNLTYDGCLAGITFNWRNRRDWKRYSDSVTEYVKWAASGEPYCCLYVQTYSSHPFVEYMPQNAIKD